MHAWRRLVAAAIAGCLGAVVAASAVGAAEVVLVTTGAVEHIMLDLIPAFERASGHTVRMAVYGTPTAVERIKAGSDLPDLVLLSPEALGELADAGKVARDTIARAFRSRVGVAVRAGAAKPDIGTAEAFKAALLAAKSIGHSIGPSGEYFSQVLVPRLGIGDAIKAKVKVIRGAPVATAVAKGEVEIGIHQIAELMPIPGIDIVGPLPPELQTTLYYGTGIAVAARDAEAARALVRFITNEAAAAAVRKNGMDPV